MHLPRHDSSHRQGTFRVKPVSRILPETGLPRRYVDHPSPPRCLTFGTLSKTPCLGIPIFVRVARSPFESIDGSHVTPGCDAWLADTTCCVRVSQERSMSRFLSFRQCSWNTQRLDSWYPRTNCHEGNGRVALSPPQIHARHQISRHWGYSRTPRVWRPISSTVPHIKVTTNG